MTQAIQNSSGTSMLIIVEDQGPYLSWLAKVTLNNTILLILIYSISNIMVYSDSASNAADLYHMVARGLSEAKAKAYVGRRPTPKALEARGREGGREGIAGEREWGEGRETDTEE